MQKIVKSYIFFSILAAFMSLFSIRVTVAQHYMPASYQSGWQTVPTPSSRVSTLPSYGKQVVRQQQKQSRYNDYYGQKGGYNGFDSLSDTGLYVGLSLGQSIAVTGQMTSTYCDPLVPANCSPNGAGDQQASSMGITFGMAVTSTTRLELSYTKFADLKYGDTAAHNDGVGTNHFPVEGGDIESNLLMASFYYSLEDMFGNFSGGQLVPYFGFGLGLAFNSVSEYTIKDDEGYEMDCFPQSDHVAEYNSESGDWDPVTLCDTYYLGRTTYAGKSTQSLAWAAELGLTWKMQNRMSIDFFFKHTNLGEISNSGMVVNDYLLDHYFETGLTVGEDSTSGWAIDNEGTGVDNDDYTIDVDEKQPFIEAFYDGVEKGDYTVSEVGIKLRIMF